MPARATRHTVEQLLELGREEFQLSGDRFTLHRFCKNAYVSVDTVYRLFGSWPEFRRRIGADETPATAFQRRSLAQRRHSDDDLLAFGRDALARLGPAMTKAQFDAHSPVTGHTVAARFGGWAAFREKLGLEPRYRGAHRNTRYFKGDLVDQLRAIASRCGEALTLKEFLRRAGLSTETFYKHFDSWEAARDCADLSPHAKARRRYSDEFLLQDLAAVARRVGRIPTQHDYQAQGHAHLWTVRRRFGPDWPDVQHRYQRWLEYRHAFPLSTIPRRFEDMSDEARAAELQRLMNQ